MLKWIGWLLAFSVIARPVFAEQEFLRDLLQGQKTRSKPIVYAECREEKGKALLILFAGTGRVVFLELENEDVVNGSDVEVRDDKFILPDAHGGVYSFARAEALARALSEYPFRFVRPEKVGLILRSIPDRQCPPAPEP